MTMFELRSMPRDKLFEISQKKGRLGNATTEAIKAQKVLQERSFYWAGVSRKPCTGAGMRIKEEGSNGFVKRFK